MKDELRAITKNQRSFDNAVMISSVMPSEKYSCSGSPLRLTKGSTAIAGLSGSGRTGPYCAYFPSCEESLSSDLWYQASYLLADESEALSRDGADQFLIVTAVAHCRSRGIDAACQGRVRDDPTSPD